MLRQIQVAPEKMKAEAEKQNEYGKRRRDETENPKGSHKSGERTTTGIWWRIEKTMAIPWRHRGRQRRTVAD
jgi:hypothetical protein